MRLLLFALVSIQAFAQIATPLIVTPGAGTASSEIRLREQRSNGDNYFGWKSPAALASDVMLVGPTGYGSGGQALTTDGAGGTSWSTIGSGLPSCASATGNDTYTCTVSGFSSYTANYCVVLKADASNTLAATVNISGGGTKSILRYGGSALATNDILANSPVIICYDGTQFQLPPSSSPGSGAWLNGGNSFGSTSSIGNNDNYDLQVKTNNLVRLTIGADGNLSFSGTAAPLFDGLGYLGTTTYRYNEVNAYTLNAASNVKSPSFTANDGTYDRIRLNNPGAGSNVGSAFTIKNASGTNIGYLTYGGTLYATAMTTTGFSLTTGAAANYVLTSDAFGTGTWQPAPSGSGLPVVDTTAVVKGSSDATKLLRFEVDGLTTATTRTLTPQNADYTIAGTDVAQTFTAAQTFNSTLNAVSGLTVNGTLVISSSRDISNITSVAQNWVPYLSSYELGSSGTRWGKLWAAAVDVSGGLSANGNVGFGGNMSFSGTATPLFDSLGSIGSSAYKYGSVYAWSHYAYTGYYMGGTQVMDSSRNLTNISSITTSGSITPGGGVATTGGGIGGTGHNTYYGGTWYYGVAAQTLSVTDAGGGTCTITIYGGVITASTC